MDNEQMPPAPKPPVTDLSQRAVQVAREIDRMPPGTYELTIQKPDVPAAEWSVEIVRVEPLRTMRLSSYLAE